MAVLLIDDDAAMVELTATFLAEELAAVETTTLTDPTDAVETLRDGAYDCVVSDYDMPQLDGLELLERIREAGIETPFVLFTGKGSEEIASRAISAGVDEYLQKGGPEEYPVLANKVENLFNNAVEHGSTGREERSSSGNRNPAASGDSRTESGDVAEQSSTGSRTESGDAVERGSTGDSGENTARTVTVGQIPEGFYVADDGPGIPESEREAVFESGYSTAAAGTGFGLNIVTNVVDAHDWEISIIESGEGGARFDISGVHD